MGSGFQTKPQAVVPKLHIGQCVVTLSAEAPKLLTGQWLQNYTLDSGSKTIHCAVAPKLHTVQWFQNYTLDSDSKTTPGISSKTSH